MEIKTAANNIYFNLGATKFDKTKAVAKGLIAAYSLYTLGTRSGFPRVISLLTLPAVALPLGLQFSNRNDLVDQHLYVKGKFPLRALLTGLTFGSFVLHPTLLQFPFLTLFLWSGASHRFRPQESQ